MAIAQGAVTRPPNGGSPLVAEMLQDELAVVGDRAADRALLADVADERVNRRTVGRVAGGDIVHRGIVLPVEPRQRAPQLSDATRQMKRAGHVLAVPEWHPRRRARRRRDDDAVVLDRRYAPGARSELKDVAHPRLVYELLVQLAQSRSVGEVDGIEPAVRDRATGDDGRHPAGPRSR
jgi:hypothetical protein